MGNPYFQFKEFTVFQNEQVFKVSTDSVLLGAWVQANNPKKILDIGTGTGLLALMMAQRFPFAFIDAVESDKQSQLCAVKNFNQSPWKNRLLLHPKPFQTFAQRQLFGQYDLLITNPPYFQNQYLPPSSSKRQFKHTVTLNYETIFKYAAFLLSQTGILAMIIPANMYSLVIESAHKYQFSVTRQLSIQIRPHQPVRRFLLQFNKISTDTTQNIDKLVIYQNNKGTDYSLDYIDLTKDFYLD